MKLVTRYALLLLAMLSWPTLVSASPNARFSDQMRIALAVNPALALTSAEAEITRTSRRQNQQEQLADALWVRAQAQWRLGNRAEAEASLARLASIRLTGRAALRMRGNRSFLTGLLARQASDFPVALTQYRAAQQQYIAARDARGQGQVLSAIGALYTDVSDNENAFRYLTMAEEVYRGDAFFNVSLNNNFGVAYVNARQHRQALVRFSRAATLADRLGIVAYATTIRANIAIAQLELGQLDAAAATLRRIGDVNALTNPDVQIKVLRTQALLAMARGNRTQAVELIDQVFEGSEIDTTTDIYRFAHASAYQIYSELGRFQDALVHLQALRRLEEADVLLRTSNRTALLAAQFGYDAQQAQIDRLKAEQLERSVAFERQRNSMQRTFIIALSIASALLLTVLLVLLITALRARNRARADEMRMSILNEQLQHALNAKSEFLATTSHEMRTPLNGIVGMTQILLSDSKLAPRVREQIELVSNAGTAMRGLVDDLLDVAKIERGGFSVNLHPAEVRPIIEDVVAQAQANAQIDGLTLAAHIDLPDEMIVVDSGRLRQIVVNLVGNAIKFTDNGSVDVTACLVEQAGGDPVLRLSVRDTGPGIAPEWQASIFELFRQVDSSRTRRYGGTGLGLAICRQIVEAMGGTIRVDSVVGAGSTFTADMPYRRANTPAPAIEMAPSLADLLIVATNPMRSALLSTMVERSGRSVAALSPEALDSALGAATDDWQRHMLIIDAQALGSVTIEAAHSALVAGLPVILVGEADDAHTHPLAAVARHAEFALNALLPLVQLEGETLADTNSSPLQIRERKRSLPPEIDADRSMGERSVGTG